ncbi:hypothetical protein [uncultured Bosea sp.]|uniref:hypothetical protein n=1 Tax=uncultured Bosea sp. TaxID=211457 RepID=UPI00263ABA76|nr:hypothetical protein [uncultured Bosea sp.]
METPVDDRTKQTTKDRLLDLDPALREKAKRWFAEAREQTKRDDEEIARWRRTSGGGDGGSGGFGDDGGGDCGGGGD